MTKKKRKKSKWMGGFSIFKTQPYYYTFDRGKNSEHYFNGHKTTLTGKPGLSPQRKSHLKDMLHET